MISSLTRKKSSGVLRSTGGNLSFLGLFFVPALFELGKNPRQVESGDLSIRFDSKTTTCNPFKTDVRYADIFRKHILREIIFRAGTYVEIRAALHRSV